MSSKIILDLSHFKHLKSDDKSTTLQHKKDGHTITLAHNALNPDNQKQLQALAKIPQEYSQSVDKNMAEGGSVSKNGRPVETLRQEQGVHKPSSLKDRDVNEPGRSHASYQKNTVNKHIHKEKLNELKQMPNPNIKGFADGGNVADNPAQTPEAMARHQQIAEALKLDPDAFQRGMEMAMGSMGTIGEIGELGSAGKEALGEAMGSAEAAQDISSMNVQNRANAVNAMKTAPQRVKVIPNIDTAAKTGNFGSVQVKANGGSVQANSTMPFPLQEYADGGDVVPVPTRTPDPEEVDDSDDDSSISPAPMPVPTPLPGNDPYAESDGPVTKTIQPPQQEEVTSKQDASLPNMDNVESGINQGFNTQIQGIKQAAAAQGAIAGEQAKILDKQVKAQSDAKAAFQEHFNALEQERQAHLQDIRNGFIDPNQYWKGDANGNGGHSKIASAIGMILAGFNPTSNPNAAINMLKYQMDQNIEAQKQNLGAKQNLLTANLHQFGNLKDATDMTRMMQNDIVTRQLQQAAAKSGSQMAQAQAMQAIGPLQRENAQIQQQFAMRRAMMSLANNPNGNPDAAAQVIGYARITNPEQAKEMESRYVPGIGFAQVPLPEKIRDELKAHVDFDNAAKDLQQWTTSHTTIVPGTADYNTGVQKALNMQALIREGQLGTVYREGEQPLLDKMIKGNPGNLLKAFNTEPQLRELIRSNNARMNTLSKSYGLPVKGSSGQSNGVQPIVVIKNGVKYYKDPKTGKNLGKVD